ncbi:uncharacterized protein B0P05DRAFT_586960 [Gilbertella persicaria]|uniref:uncharacterized protein n=1 Tax=Gilbertella persicaria TaxID=101096 RepID=UPI00221FEEA7|nr:uncharacterized protein B0P05DRAFT_586960 [Gilbertella persicaria]KAI8079503.1 hypothetical protein B0P05DRAFT_586960 [Gilbertella persicaria]
MGLIQLKQMQPLAPSHQTNTQKQAPLLLDTEAYKKRFESIVKKKTTKVDKSQLVVPVLPSIQQQNAYELLIEENGRFKKIVGNPTVKSVIEMFSYHPTETGLEATGKLSVLSKFFTRIQESDINFDTAIVCADKDSETMLYERLIESSLGLNIRELSSFASLKDIHGVIVKHRKKDKPNDIITRTDVDLVVMYEPALNSSPDISQFKGATFDSPSVIRLTTANSPEIRFSEEDIEVWNTMLANSIFEWAKKKEKTPYELAYSPHTLSVYKIGKKIGYPSKPNPHTSTMSTPIAIPKQKAEEQKQQQRQKQQAKRNNKKTLETAQAFSERSQAQQQQEQPAQQKRKISLPPPPSPPSSSSKKQKTSQSQHEQEQGTKIETKDTSEPISSGPLPDLNSIFQNALDQFEKDLNSIKIKL